MPTTDPVSTTNVEVDLTVEDPGWNAASLAPTLIAAATSAVDNAVGPSADAARVRGVELSLVLADDAFVRRLNRDWRGSDAATNVLSFPAEAEGAPAGAPLMLGDVVLARETVEREAAERNKPVVHHAAHLVCHGTLHLLGYDHLTEREADTMERLETRILGELGMADPYVAGGTAAAEIRS